jgi:hypothetical protein
MVRLSDLLSDHIYPPPPGNKADGHFYSNFNRFQGHRAAGRITKMKNPSEPIGNRNRELLACSAVPQQNAPPNLT